MTIPLVYHLAMRFRSLVWLTLALSMGALGCPGSSPSEAPNATEPDTAAEEVSFQQQDGAARVEDAEYTEDAETGSDLVTEPTDLVTEPTDLVTELTDLRTEPVDSSGVLDIGPGDAGTEPTDEGQVEPPDLGPVGSDAGPAPDPGPEPPPPLTDYPLPPIPDACELKAKVITYNPNGWSRITDAFEDNLTPCADYYIFIPALTGDKTWPRGKKAAAGVRARKGRFHALAEFHWHSWKKVTSMTWYERGVEFRKRMGETDYNVERGDSWAINELPSKVRTDPATRQAVRDVVKGLTAGPAGAIERPGVVYVIAMGQPTVNHNVYKPQMKDWLTDKPFWTDMKGRVKFWGQETYPSPDYTCVPDAVVGLKSQNLNAYIQHPAILAEVGPSSANVAQAYFNFNYFSLMTAVWNSPAYGGTQVSLEVMEKLVSLQVYAARAWASSHDYPDGRVGFAWYNNAPDKTPEQMDDLAERLAGAIAGAYGIGGKAKHACSPSGAYTWCGCSVPGAEFNPKWSTYETW